jgi:electron transfer flavoprotein alpha subunit
MVYTEFTDGAFKKSALEVVSEGRRLADAMGADLTAVALGSGVSDSAAQLGTYGADTVWWLMMPLWPISPVMPIPTPSVP